MGFSYYKSIAWDTECANKRVCVTGLKTVALEKPASKVSLGSHLGTWLVNTSLCCYQTFPIDEGGSLSLACANNKVPAKHLLSFWNLGSCWVEGAYLTSPQWNKPWVLSPDEPHKHTHSTSQVWSRCVAGEWSTTSIFWKRKLEPGFLQTSLHAAVPLADFALHPAALSLNCECNHVLSLARPSSKSSNLGRLSTCSLADN